ncbi:hypothetical protein [Nocardia jiangsuensis]|uniref:Uncharacterized protein n=1 Tax=Nocardia jiangsuensis TaxID=1691563 RepID=A0ABV8DYN8_9NOCA
MSARQFHLNAFPMGVGHHEAAWRHPRTEEHRVLDVAHFQESEAHVLSPRRPSSRRRAAELVRKRRRRRLRHQRRGLFRTEYTADTLRGHYGLDRVESRFAGASA